MLKRGNPGRRAYTPEEVAEMYGVHVDTIRRLIRERKLIALKLGQQWRITPQALDDYEETIRSRCSTRPDDETAAGS